MRYLDPRADLTFKRIFGEHKELIKNFLNALLPLKEGDEIEDLEFLPAEQAPDSPMREDSIVNVRCWDKYRRPFFVEIQIYLTHFYRLRVLFNDSKVYVRQSKKSVDYAYQQPLYSLNLINFAFLPDSEDFYHYYDIVNVEHSDKVIDGLHFVFVELPKFKPQSISGRKMAVLWLRFLTELNAGTDTVPEDFLENPYLKQAVQILDRYSYNERDLYTYEKYWDWVGYELALFNDAYKKGVQLGIEEARKQALEEAKKQGFEEGKNLGAKESLVAIVRKMKSMGLSNEKIAKVTNLTIDDIENL